MRLLLPLLAAAALAAEESGPFKPGVDYATWTFPGLSVHAPADQAEALRPLAGRTLAIYRRMQADAGWTPTRRLHVVFTDDEDAHNGFSSVVPFPLLNVQLGPTRPDSGLFSGHDETVRTLVHELAHHLANDRNHGWRAVLEAVFGRVMPSEPLSLAVFALSTPNHVLSPAFWHEGVAQWAETAYADPAAAWAGRGRDALIHMVWRLDAAAGAIPEADDWRLDHPTWPFGNRAYLYGLAYTRWLDAAFGDRRGLWRMVDEQGRLPTPFAFQGGSERAVGFRHDPLIARMRADLLAEQQDALAVLGSVPTTTTRRLTRTQWRVGVPAWTATGRLAYAADSPWAEPGLQELTLRSKLAPRPPGGHAWSLAPLRRVGERSWVRAEAPVGSDRWRRSRVEIDGAVLPGERLWQPDARPAAAGHDVAAIELLPAGGVRLVLARGATPAAADWRPLPSQGRPWSPAFRPGHDELCWVETDAAGSRLVLAGLDGGERRVLWQVRGRILHPAWDPAGTQVFCASDASGVANAWCVPLDGPARPVTNVVGGILAAVPSPDGSQLAVLDHDAGGPYLAVLELDPATWPAQLPRLDLAWPAPIERQPLGPAAAGEDRPGQPAPLPPAGEDPGAAQPYAGWREIRPRFWTPTLLAVPEGGFGAVGVATDPLLSHTVVASVGRGYADKSAVGLASWTWNGWEPGLGILAKRAELGYDRQVLASDGNLYDYTETVDTIEARVGYGMGGFRRRWQGWLAAGIDRHRPVDSAVDDYAGLATAAPDPFIGSERYVEATVAYDDSLLFPTSYAREDGLSLAGSVRATEPRGNRALAQASYSLPVWAEGGHQLVGAGQLGWSDGPRDLQGRFGVGGDRAMGAPRGYPLTMARGRALEAWSLAYRFPLWRPFDGAGTTPWVTRQFVAELFWEGARAGDRLGEGDWFRSAGAELHLEFSFWTVRFAPGLGVARQVDGEEDDAGYLSLGFRW
jgi:hypothetical protein